MVLSRGVVNWYLQIKSQQSVRYPKQNTNAQTAVWRPWSVWFCLRSKWNTTFQYIYVSYTRECKIFFFQIFFYIINVYADKSLLRMKNWNVLNPCLNKLTYNNCLGNKRCICIPSYLINNRIMKIAAHVAMKSYQKLNEPDGKSRNLYF